MPLGDENRKILMMGDCETRAPELIQGPGVLPNRRGKQVVKRERGLRGREVHM